LINYHIHNSEDRKKNIEITVRETVFLIKYFY